MPLSRPEPLAETHDLNDFFSGVSSLADWLPSSKRPSGSETTRYDPPHSAATLSDAQAYLARRAHRNQAGLEAANRPRRERTVVVSCENGTAERAMTDTE